MAEFKSSMNTVSFLSLTFIVLMSSFPKSVSFYYSSSVPGLVHIGEDSKLAKIGDFSVAGCEGD
jgi:hypothetical protein